MAAVDLAVTGAWIVDGSGRPPFKGCVLVSDGVVADIADAAPVGGAREVFDAGGLFLAPGFIDCHGHSDISILAAPDAFGKISQGVTTEIVGNCGLSVFPVSDSNRGHLQGLFRRYGVDISWSSGADYAAEVDTRRPAINIASLVGHNTLRASVMGYSRREASPEDVRGMEEALSRESALARGFSTGLLYVPGMFAGEDELVDLVRANAAAGGAHVSHPRSEGDDVLEALGEFLRVSRRAGASRAHVSHLKVSGERNWEKLDAVLDMLEAAREEGMVVTADAYPYVESMTQLGALLPEPWSEMGDIELEGALAEGAERERLASALERDFAPGRWSSLILVSSSAENAVSGSTLEENAASAGSPPWEFCVGLLAADAPGTMVASRGMSRENMERIVSLPWVCCCTDETARPPDGAFGAGHPRGFGAFPEFLKVASRMGVPLEEAVRRMTSLPASIFGLEGRGALSRGFRADMVLFDLERLLESASADFASPLRVNPGVVSVWVSGSPAYSAGRVVGRHGRFLDVAEG